jgi:hypothetical protein
MKFTLEEDVLIKVTIHPVTAEVISALKKDYE